MSEKQLDLNKIGARIKELFEQNRTDEDIAIDVKLPVGNVISIRNMLGLKRRWAVNVFEKEKKLMTDSKGWFRLQFNIPHDLETKIGIDNKKDYNYICSASKGEIKIEFLERHD